VSKPGKVSGPIRVKPNKKSDLTDYRRAKRLQDYLNWELSKEIRQVNKALLEGDWWRGTPDKE
jgi:hypothetical protein